MTTPASTPTANSSQRGSPQVQAILRNLTAKVLAFHARNEAAQIRAISEHLLELSEDSSTAASTDAYRFRSVSFLLEKQAGKLTAAYQNALKQALQESVTAVLTDPSALDTSLVGSDPMEGMSLSLIDEAEMDELLTLDQVSHRFNNHYESKLHSLNQRLGMLITGQVTGLSNNPYRPEVLVRALMSGWKSSGFDDQMCTDLLRALSPTHSLDLGPLYDDLTQTLNQAGVSAKASHRIRKTAESESSFGGMPDNSAGADAESAQTGFASSGFSPSQPTRVAGANTLAASMPEFGSTSHEPFVPELEGLEPVATVAGGFSATAHSLMAQARQFLRQMGFGASHSQFSAPVQQAPADSRLIGYLEDLQPDAGAALLSSVTELEGMAQNVLRGIRDHDQFRQAADIDRGTIDALAEVFDFVFSDPAIPAAMKVVIGRLQIPVLKAAMIDREFFHSEAHPARRLIDALARAALAWSPAKGEEDPLYVQIDNTVHRALAEFDQDLNLFVLLLQEFDAFVQSAEQAAQAQIEPVVQVQEADEAKAMAQVQADEIIHARIHAVPASSPLAPMLLPFLAGPWRDVMTKAWLDAREQPEAWNERLATLDTLIWSTQPQVKVHVERRQRSPELVPLPQERRQVMRVLPDLVRQLDQALDSIAWSGKPRTEFMAGLMELHMQVIRQALPTPEELALRVSEALAAENAMQELIARRAQAQAPIDDDFEHMARSLERGNWFDYLTERGQLHRCRLSWISPKRTRMLFTNREGFDAFVRSEREVAELLREARLTAIDETPIVGRALDQILAQ